MASSERTEPTSKTPRVSIPRIVSNAKTQRERATITEAGQYKPARTQGAELGLTTVYVLRDF
jgi:hypothetical protein